MDIDDVSEGSRSPLNQLPPSTTASGSPAAPTPPQTLAFIDRTESRVFSRSGHLPHVPNPAYSGYVSDTTASQYDVDDEDDDDAVEETMAMKAKSVLKQVRDEFYDWEPDASRATLRSLVPAQPRALAGGEAQEMDDLLAALERGPAWANSATSDADVDDDTNDIFPKVKIIHRTSSGQERVQTVNCTVVHVPALEPHPPYESCTPSSRTLRLLDADRATLRFIPYADQVEFPIRKVLRSKNWDNWAWDEDFDPDSEMIQIEAARRVASLHGLTVNEIDNLGVLEKDLRHSSFNNTGLLHDVAQRDHLHWPGSFREQPHEHVLPDSFAPREEDEVARHESVLRVRCPNPSCAGLLCHEHNYPYPSEIPIRQPTLTSQQLRERPGVPCGDRCFRFVEDILDYQMINPTIANNCEAILKQFPDDLPCDLVLLTDLPCQEIYAHRLDVFPDEGIQGEDNTSYARKHEGRRGGFRDKIDYIPSLPCAHRGPCTEETCDCAKNKLYCQLSCSCGIQCWRQRKGCKCPRGRHSCQTTKCSCFRASRECMPGICGRCDAKGATSRPCRNTVVQRGEGKDIEVKRGMYGLGAFARQRLYTGDYLGDYTGILMTTSEAGRDEAVRKHTHLNYLFEFDITYGSTSVNGNSGVSIDAHRVGNFTRFLNHANDNGVNVVVKPMVVNGDPRLVLQALRNIQAGEELFLSYGDKYWPGDEEGDDGDDDDQGGDADDEAD